MENEPKVQKNNNLREGTAVGEWIIRKSKTYPDHHYYFNTLTGEAVWNLSEQEIASAKRVTYAYKVGNQIEPKDKPPMARLNSTSSYSHQILNNQFTTDALPPISTFICPQSSVHTALASINSIDLIATQPKLDPNVWDLGLRQPILILPTVTSLNPPQQPTVNIGYNLQQRNNVYTRENMFNNNRGINNRFGKNRVQNIQNRHETKFSRPDLRKRLSKYEHYNKNDINISKTSITGLKKSERYTQRGASREEIQYEPPLLEENEENCISKIDCMPLRILGKSTANKDCWYLVVDTNVLLNNFNYLNNLTSTDSNCCFLIPNCVHNELESYAKEGKDVTTRRVLRFLYDHASIGLEELEVEPEVEDSSPPDVFKRIYNICVNIGKNNYHVVLISDNKNLLIHKNNIHVFSMAEVKNMISDYVSGRNLLTCSTSMSDRVVRINRNSDVNRKMGSNHIVTVSPKKPHDNINKTRTFSVSQEVENNMEIDKSPSKTSNTQMNTELTNKICPLKSNNNTSDLIDNRQIENSENSTNITEAVKGDIIEQTTSNNTKESSTLTENGVRVQKRVIKLNRNELLSHKDTSATLNATEKKKFRWRKRRNHSSEVATVSSTIGSELTPDSHERGMDLSENIEENSDNIENKSKDFENDESSSSCIFVKKGTGECILVEETSSSGIISNSGSNVDSINLLNINQRRPKLQQSFTHTNKNVLNNVMFEVSSQDMEETLKMRCDEWVSRFVQIMEDVLSQILRQDSMIERIALPPPWSLHEAVQCIIKEFYRHCYVVDAANKLSIISNNVLTKSVTNILPAEFMEMYSYGVYLVNALKDIQETNEDLKIASKSLSDLLHDIENPHLESQNDTFIDEAPQGEEETAPISNVSLKENVHADIEMQSNSSPQKYNLRQRKRHTSEIEESTTPAKVALKEDVMVTFMSSIPLENNYDNKEKDTEKPNETLENIQETIDNDVVDGVAENENYISTNEPKIVRRFTKFAQFEERLKNSYRTSTDMDWDIYSDEEDHYDNSNNSIDDEDIRDLYGLRDMRSCKETVVQSKGQVELYFKEFFNDINEVFSRAQEFCKSCVFYLKKPRPLSVNKKLQVKTDKLHSEVINIHHLLDSILSRDNGEANITHLLKKAGICLEKTSKQYRNNIMKCKDKASILLKVIEHISIAIKR